jgi:hypothetical protein
VGPRHQRQQGKEGGARVSQAAGWARPKQKRGEKSEDGHAVKLGRGRK